MSFLDGATSHILACIDGKVTLSKDRRRVTLQLHDCGEMDLDTSSGDSTVNATMTLEAAAELAEALKMAVSAAAVKK